MSILRRKLSLPFIHIIFSSVSESSCDGGAPNSLKGACGLQSDFICCLYLHLFVGSLCEGAFERRIRFYWRFVCTTLTTHFTRSCQQEESSYSIVCYRIVLPFLLPSSCIVLGVIFELLQDFGGEDSLYFCYRHQQVWFLWRLPFYMQVTGIKQACNLCFLGNIYGWDLK